MVALGIVTLVLTAYMLVFYGYLSKHTDSDVSFFMSVGLISMIMNLCTNMTGMYGIAWLYFAIALAFIGLGFAVSTEGSVAFYTSIGPWFKTQFSDMKTCGFSVLSAVCFPAGLILYFVNYKKNRTFGNVCGKAALWGIVLWAFLLWAILGLVL